MIDLPLCSRRFPSVLSMVALGVVACLVTACGGGGPATTSSTPQPPAPQPPVNSGAVTVSCQPAILAPLNTAQCSAMQSDGTAASVSWSVSAGAISSTGLFTAPTALGAVTITATNSKDTAQTGAATLTVQLKTPASQHVVMLMEENQDYTEVIGAKYWPKFNALAAEGALATNYYADVHPSIGNYFMLTTGQTVTTNDNSTQLYDVDSMARRMIAAGVTFRIYAEGITRGYVGGNTGNYVVRHNPFALLKDVGGDPNEANKVLWPFSQFAIDVANHALPQFSFIVPDIMDNAHTGTQGQADTWLKVNVVDQLSTDPAFQAGGDGILIVDFDEGAGTDTANGGGRVSPVFWGPNVLVGYQQKSNTVYQHESMLRTVMEALGLPNPPAKAATAPSMAEFFVQK